MISETAIPLRSVCGLGQSSFSPCFRGSGVSWCMGFSVCVSQSRKKALENACFHVKNEEP
jgi:hypothetical protein